MVILCTFCSSDALFICNSDLTIQNASLHTSISKVSSSSTNYIYSNITILLIDFSTRHIYTFQITLHSSYIKISTTVVVKFKGLTFLQYRFKILSRSLVYKFLTCLGFTVNAILIWTISWNLTAKSFQYEDNFKVLPRHIHLKCCIYLGFSSFLTSSIIQYLCN